MRTFLKLFCYYWPEYWARFVRLPWNPGLYIWFLLIGLGGHTLTGKLVYMALSLIIIPIFQLWDERIDEGLDP